MTEPKKLSFEATYILQAQSPLIHFQHRQNGAVLRATEVKPKLDSFLKKKLENTVDYSDWLIKDDKKSAFNYKMRIVAEGQSKKTEPPRIYYGNMNVEENKKVSCVSVDCKITIICFIPELMNAIKSCIGEFFVCTNFGRMQNKGFGSFTVCGNEFSTEEVGKMLIRDAGAKACYYITGYNPKNTEEIFEDISKVYSVMKSGINHNGYHRSYLFEYFHEKMGTGNEKALMKKEKISPWKDGEPVKHPDNKRIFPEQNVKTYKYVRALLGIGEHIEYITGFHRATNKRGQECWKSSKNECVKIKIYNGNAIEDNAADDNANDNGTIVRFASPIFFKIINGTVFIVPKRINPVIFNQPFTFQNDATKKSITVDVPESFDVDDFLYWFVGKYNRESSQKNYAGRLPFYSIGKKIIELKGDLA